MLMNTLSTDPNAPRDSAITNPSRARVIALCPDRANADTGQTCRTAPTIAENQCEVRSNAWVNAEYKHLVLTAPELALTACAGQFFHLACPASNDDSPYLRRPMSIYCVNAEDGRIEFLYKVQGAGTRGLAQLQPGDTLDALGPLGKGFELPASSEPAHVLLLGRGVGLATMAPLAQQAISAGARVTAILSARSEALMMSADFLQATGADVITVTDDEQTSDVVQVESIIRRVYERRRITYAATCGSNRLLVMLQRVASQLNIPGQVALEQRMGCGYGACYACVRPFRKEPGSEELSYRRVCWEGPVFDLQETTSW
jgi:dihydroorotate dehydrogenase electron transfer subunit